MNYRIYNYVVMIVNMNSNSIHNKRPKSIWSDWIFEFVRIRFLIFAAKESVLLYGQCQWRWDNFFWKCHHLKIIKNWQSPAHTHTPHQIDTGYNNNMGAIEKCLNSFFFCFWLSLNLYFFKRKWLVGWWWYSFVLFDWLVDVVEFIQFQIM